jgi:peroxiredoxin
MHIEMRYKRVLIGIGLAASVAMTQVALSRQSLAEAKKNAPAPTKLKVGDSAPDFTLLAFDGKAVKPVSLHDYRGKKNVALAFYVFAFTGG